MPILDHIEQPSDLRGLSRRELSDLAVEIRERIISVTSRNGGHIGPNLGVVELTLALHLVFDCPQDRFVWDVSHQGYVHKLLTGRRGPEFDALRQTNGVSGFLNREESEWDAYGAGHAGTALSAAVGMAAARDRMNQSNHVVAILGDAAFTCGITMEALNNVISATDRLIIILNDNEWSIAKNVGALAKYFNELITNPVYNRLDKEFASFIEKMPGGQSMLELGRKWKKETKDFFVDSSLFETYGLRYIGPIDGHDLDMVVKQLEFAKGSDKPILIHLLTKKGKGYPPALARPEKFHGLGPFDRETGESPQSGPNPPNYQDAFGQNLLKFAQADPSIVGITAAMPPGTGLSFLRENLPDQFFDVGIAEEHAVIFAAGMACEGVKPVVAIYSTFLQRAYDPIIHDVCLQNLQVIFCMDRAGLSPNDGATHHGLFDIAYLRCVPNLILMQPRDEDELADMLWTCLKHPGPSFIRYPRGAGIGVHCKTDPMRISIGQSEVIRQGQDIQFWALGPWVAEAESIAEDLSAELDLDIGVVNARFVKPLDEGLLSAQAKDARLIVTFEDHVIQGGFGSAVLEYFSDSGIRDVAVERIGYPDSFVDHASSTEDVRAMVELDRESVKQKIVKKLQSLSPTGKTLFAG